MLRTVFTASCLFLLSSCVIPRTVDRLQDREPPEDFGRPGVVRFFAGTGAWIGGILGGAVSVVLLPVTYPISLLADDGLGEAGKEEIMFFPAVGFAATGHFLLGTPVDALDFTFRRAWFSDPQPPNTYELVPMGPPKSPTMDDVPPPVGQEGPPAPVSDPVGPDPAGPDPDRDQS